MGQSHLGYGPDIPPGKSPGPRRVDGCRRWLGAENVVNSSLGVDVELRDDASLWKDWRVAGRPGQSAIEWLQVGSWCLLTASQMEMPIAICGLKGGTAIRWQITATGRGRSVT